MDIVNRVLARVFDGMLTLSLFGICAMLIVGFVMATMVTNVDVLEKLELLYLLLNVSTILLGAIVLGQYRIRRWRCDQLCTVTDQQADQADAITQALRHVYPRYCVVTRWSTVHRNEPTHYDEPPYYIYMTADAPAVRPGQTVTTGNQYLVIRGMYESPYDAAGVGCSIDTLTIRADAQVTPATPVTCIRTEPLRYFAMRVVHGIGGGDNGAC